MGYSSGAMQPTLNFRVRGGRKLRGEITVNSSKNGAVGLLCASLINRGKTVLKNVPQIEEVHRIIEVLRSIGVSVTWDDHTLTITPPKAFSMSQMDTEAAEKTRSILMFIGSLIHSMPTMRIPQAGGCKLGSRTVRPHKYALEKFGVRIVSGGAAWKVSHNKLQAADILMYESGDTATINAILAAAGIKGTSVIKYASANYQVQDVCQYLAQLGVKIDGIGTTTLTISGKRNIKKTISFELSEDPTDAMFFLASAIVTRSSIVIKRVPIDFMELELYKLELMGFTYDVVRRYKGRNGYVNLVDIRTHAKPLVASPEKIYGRPYPGLNIDNLPFFAVIATQARGTTLIHDWAYEGRALYFAELNKLGAKAMLADPHRVFIEGRTPLKAADLTCPPALRPAAILLIAMLAAKGTSTLSNIYSINRGYEGLAEKLQSLGAQVEVYEG